MTTMYTQTSGIMSLGVNTYHQCICIIKLFYAGLISHNGLGGVELDLTIVQTGMGTFQ